MASRAPFGSPSPAGRRDFRLLNEATPAHAGEHHTAAPAETRTTDRSPQEGSSVEPPQGDGLAIPYHPGERSPQEGSSVGPFSPQWPAQGDAESTIGALTEFSREPRITPGPLAATLTALLGSEAIAEITADQAALAAAFADETDEPADSGTVTSPAAEHPAVEQPDDEAAPPLVVHTSSLSETAPIMAFDIFVPPVDLILALRPALLDGTFVDIDEVRSQPPSFFSPNGVADMLIPAYIDHRDAYHCARDDIGRARRGARFTFRANDVADVPIPANVRQLDQDGLTQATVDRAQEYVRTWTADAHQEPDATTIYLQHHFSIVRQNRPHGRFPHLAFLIPSRIACGLETADAVYQYIAGTYLSDRPYYAIPINDVRLHGEVTRPGAQVPPARSSGIFRYDPNATADELARETVDLIEFRRLHSTALACPPAYYLDEIPWDPDFPDDHYGLLVTDDHLDNDSFDYNPPFGYGAAVDYQPPGPALQQQITGEDDNMSQELSAPSDSASDTDDSETADEHHARDPRTVAHATNRPRPINQPTGSLHYREMTALISQVQNLLIEANEAHRIGSESRAASAERHARIAATAHRQSMAALNAITANQSVISSSFADQQRAMNHSINALTDMVTRQPPPATAPEPPAPPPLPAGMVYSTQTGKAIKERSEKANASRNKKAKQESDSSISSSGTDTTNGKRKKAPSPTSDQPDAEEPQSRPAGEVNPWSNTGELRPMSGIPSMDATAFNISRHPEALNAFATTSAAEQQFPRRTLEARAALDAATRDRPAQQRATVTPAQAQANPTKHPAQPTPTPAERRYEHPAAAPSEPNQRPPGNPSRIAAQALLLSHERAAEALHGDPPSSTLIIQNAKLARTIGRLVSNPYPRPLPNPGTLPARCVAIVDSLRARPIRFQMSLDAFRLAINESVRTLFEPDEFAEPIIGFLEAIATEIANATIDPNSARARNLFFEPSRAMMQAAFDATLGQHGSYGHWLNMAERHQIRHVILQFPERDDCRITTSTLGPRPNYNHDQRIFASAHTLTPRYIQVGEALRHHTVDSGGRLASANHDALTARRAANAALFGETDEQLAISIADALFVLGRPAHYHLDQGDLAGLLSARLKELIPAASSDRDAFAHFIRGLAMEIFSDNQTRRTQLDINHTQIRRAFEATFGEGGRYAAFIDNANMDILRTQIGEFDRDADPQTSCPACRSRIHIAPTRCTWCSSEAIVGPLCRACLRMGDRPLKKQPDDSSEDQPIPTTQVTLQEELPVIPEDLELLLIQNAADLCNNADEAGHLFARTHDAVFRQAVLTAVQTAIQAVCRHSRSPVPNTIRPCLPGGLRSSVVINVRQLPDASTDVPDNEERPAP